MNMIPRSLWQAVADKVAKQLSQAEWQRASQLNSATGVKAILSTVRSTSQTPTLEHVCARLDTVIQLSHLVCEASYELSHMLEGIPGLIWGLLGLAIETFDNNQSTIRDIEFLDLVVKMYEHLLNSIPRLRSFSSVLEQSPNLALVIFGVYEEYINLALRTVKAFGHGGISIVTKLKWKRDQKAFHTTIRRLRRLKDIAIQEASAANVVGEQVWRDAVLAAVTTNDSASLQTVGTIDLASLSLSEPGFPQFIVPPRNANFIGRRKELSLLEDLLDPENVAPEKRLRCVVLLGLGGVGKTQIASEFAHRHRAHYDACFWIAADGPVKVAQGIDEIARKLLIQDVGHAQLRTRVKEWFCETDKSWLLIFDNAEDPQDLLEYFPPAASGAILLTSQYRNWLHQESVDRGIRLGSLDRVEGIKMLQSIIHRYGQDIADEHAYGIVKEVGGLPLAIKQIGSYIATTHANARQFLVEYQDSAEAHRAESWVVEGSQSTSHTLATVWKLALARLSSPSVFLLNVMVLMDPDSIPVDFFSSELESGTLSPHLNTITEYDTALSNLQSYSLVLLSSTEGGDPVLIIHRQVRRNILSRLGSEEMQHAFQWVLKKLRKEFPHQSPFAEPLSRSWPQCEPWISHLMSVNSITKSFKNTLVAPELLAEILVDGSIYLWERGILEQGRQLILSAKDICESRDGDQLLLATVYSFYGCILSDSGEIDQALIYFDHEVQKRKAYLHDLSRRRIKPTMTDEIQLANAYNNFGGILCAHRRFQDAELNNRLSLALKERWKDKGDLDYLLSLSCSNIANMCGQQQKWDEAADWYQKALGIDEDKHYAPRRALIYHNFGCMRMMQGLTHPAIVLLTEAVQIRTKNLGDHYDTASTLHLLACCYQEIEDMISARDLLEEALRMLNRPHLRDLRRIARTKFRLSIVLARLNAADADRVRQEAIEMKRHVTGNISKNGEREEDFDELVPYI